MNDHATPLIIAAQSGNIDLCRLLLQHGADIQATSTRGATALFAAAQSGRANVCALLIQRGLACDAPMSNGATPLIIAAYKGHADTVRVLLDAGANPMHEDVTHNTAMSYAEQAGHIAVVEMIQQYLQVADCLSTCVCFAEFAKLCVFCVSVNDRDN